MEKIQAVVFDVYGTLINIEVDEDRPDTYTFLSQWLSYHGIDINPRDLHHRYRQFCHEEICKSTEDGPDIEIGNVFRRIIADYELSLQNFGWIVEELAILFRMLTTKSLSMYPGVASMLNTIRGKVRLGIVSNSQRLFTVPELAKFQVADFFDKAVFSSDVGVCKPNARIFQSLLTSLSVLPESALFVGDNIVDDIYGAKTIGMKTVWVNRGLQQADTGTADLAKPDYEIRHGTYNELRDIILSLL